MKPIRKVCVVGAGAIGSLFAGAMQNSLIKRACASAANPLDRSK